MYKPMTLCEYFNLLYCDVFSGQQTSISPFYHCDGSSDRQRGYCCDLAQQPDEREREILLFFVAAARKVKEYTHIKYDK